MEETLTARKYEHERRLQGSRNTIRRKSNRLAMNQQKKAKKRI